MWMNMEETVTEYDSRISRHIIIATYLTEGALPLHCVCVSANPKIRTVDGVHRRNENATV